MTDAERIRLAGMAFLNLVKLCWVPRDPVDITLLETCDTGFTALARYCRQRAAALERVNRDAEQ